VVERRWVVPAFAKRVRDVTDDWTPQLELKIVPGRSVAVPIVELDGLRVTLVAGIVVSTVAEVDTADEGHVVVGTRRAPYQNQLLVMAAASAHAFVEQDLTARVVDHANELRVLLLTEMSLSRM
jgi:hypothetical protein